MWRALALSVVLEVFVSYARYESILKWTTLSLLAYLAVPFVAHLDWRAVLRGLVVPALGGGRTQAMALVALLGTTISPYLFFWQAGQEVEEQHREHTRPLRLRPHGAMRAPMRLRVDTMVGMGVTHVTALAIIIATAATLHQHGITTVASADQAALALRPIAGNHAFLLFAVGIIGTGLLAVPVLAGSAAYALSETFGWAEGLDRRPREAGAFMARLAWRWRAGWGSTCWG
jgi:Mn2+/Fe2+ NRAMP family transporter